MLCNSTTRYACISRSVLETFDAWSLTDIQHAARRLWLVPTVEVVVLQGFSSLLAEKTADL